MSKALESLLNEQALHGEEMLESLGLLSPPAKRVFPPLQPTEAQRIEVEKLAKSLIGKDGGAEDESQPAHVDLLSKPHVVLLQGRLSKLNSSTFKLTKASKRHLFLLNDVLLITAPKVSMMSSAERYVVHGVVPLDQVSIRPYFYSELDPSADAGSQPGSPQPASSSPPAPVHAIEVVSAEKTFHFLAESDSDRRLWLDAIASAAVAFLEQQQALGAAVLVPGHVPHLVQRGTVASAAMRADMAELAHLLQRQPFGALGGGSSGKGSALFDLDATDALSMAPLHWAALSGNVKIVEALVQRGADVNVLNNALNTPLLLAAAGGYTDIVMFLLDHEADAAVRNLKDRDALFHAALYAHRSSGLSVIMDALLQRGCSFETVDSSGNMSLHACAARGLVNPLQILCDLGCDVNARTAPLEASSSSSSSGTRSGPLTALLTACSQPLPDAEVIRALLEKGAGPNAKYSLTGSGGATTHVLLGPMDAVLRGFAQRRASITAAVATTAVSAGAGVGVGVDSQSGGAASAESVAEFVQLCLPALMELAKRGCRYADHSLAGLRPSFVEAVNSARLHWTRMSEPAQFASMVGVMHMGKADEGWARDNSSSSCLCCGDAFSFTLRRHHCRACGVLCCNFCSGKTLTFKSPLDERNAAAADQASKSPQRVCDGCFNASLCVFEYKAQALAQVQSSPSRKSREQDPAPVIDVGSLALAMPAASPASSSSPSLSPPPSLSPTPSNGGASTPKDGPLSALKSSLFSWSSSSTSAKTPSATSAPSTPRGPPAASTASGAAAEALAAMQARGEKLGELADKGADMQDAASEFHDLSAQLRKQMQQRGTGWM